MGWVNMTPHDVVVYDDGGEIMVTIPASGQIARCAETTTRVGMVDGIPVVRKDYGDIVDLPMEVEGGDRYIVSALVSAAGAKLGRRDLYSPADLVRNSTGAVVGCKSLAQA